MYTVICLKMCCRYCFWRFGVLFQRHCSLRIWPFDSRMHFRMHSLLDYRIFSTQTHEKSNKKIVSKTANHVFSASKFTFFCFFECRF